MAKDGRPARGYVVKNDIVPSSPNGPTNE